MSPELSTFLKDHEPSTEAARHFGVTHDYVSLLCRRKKVRGMLVGRLWFVEVNSLRAYLARMEEERSRRNTLLSMQARNELKKTI